METTEMTNFYRKHYGVLVGRKIIAIRSMYPEEMKLFMWYGDPGVVIETDKGLIVPSSDPEGNSPGQLLLDGFE